MPWKLYENIIENLLPHTLTEAPMIRRLPLFLCLSLLLVCLAVQAPAAPAAEAAHEISIRVDPALKSMGIHAANATTLAKGAKGNPGPGPAVVVFVSFEQPFYGDLHLRGYTKDNTEIARSAIMTMNKKPDAGGHLTFSFDAPTSFAKVSHFILMGEKRQGPPPRPAPRQEGIGEETRNIVRELLQ